MREAQLLLTFGANLPLPVLSHLTGGIGRAMARAGCGDAVITNGLEVYALLPEPGTRAEFHDVTLLRSDVHPAMIDWACSCGEKAPASYGDIGSATFFAVEHVPPGEGWAVAPDKALLTKAG